METSKDGDDGIRRIFLDRAQKLTEEVVKSDGELCEEKFEELERLSKLLAIYKTAWPDGPRKRWPAMVAFGITLTIVSILLFARVPETEIELDVVLSELEFRLFENQVLSEVVSLAALGVSGVQRIELPGRESGQTRSLSVAQKERELSIRLATTSATVHKGTVTLSPLILKAGTRVILNTSNLSNKYSIYLNDVEMNIYVHVNGSVRVDIPPQSSSQLDLPSPKTVIISTSSDREIDLDLDFTEGSTDFFSSPVTIDYIKLNKIKQYTGPDRTVVRSVSTIESGYLLRNSLKDEKHDLRAAEFLSFDVIKGDIERLGFQDGSIKVHFLGRVRGLSIGISEGNKNLMPTFLEWLRARHGISLFWGTSVYFIGLISTALRWWRGST